MSWRRVLWPLSGRLNRKGFLLGLLLVTTVQILMMIVVALAAFFAFANNAPEASWLWFQSRVWTFIGFAAIMSGAIYWSGSLFVRRLHDIGWFGWLFVLPGTAMLWSPFLMVWRATSDLAQAPPTFDLLPVIVLGSCISAVPFWLAALMWPGQHHANRHGPPPTGRWGVSEAVDRDRLAATFA